SNFVSDELLQKPAWVEDIGDMGRVRSAYQYEEDLIECFAARRPGIADALLLALFRRRHIFFFQAEDVIRYRNVTGVQTCALPILADGPASEFYYDRKKMMAYAPAENLVAVADAPPTIDAALEQAYHSAAIYFPFDDWIVADPYKEMSDGMNLAYYIGQSKVVGGTTTDMVAYIDHGVFIQAWIGAGDKLPRLLHAVYLDDPERLRHTLVLSDWQLDAAVPPDTFTSAKAASANPMPFAHPHPEDSPGAEPT